MEARGDARSASGSESSDKAEADETLSTGEGAVLQRQRTAPRLETAQLPDPQKRSREKQEPRAGPHGSARVGRGGRNLHRKVGSRGATRQGLQGAETSPDMVNDLEVQHGTDVAPAVKFNRTGGDGLVCGEASAQGTFDGTRRTCTSTPGP